ncbi:hypothetical protein AVEN_175542-1 [Araneus ventricosus]|uniref:Uncharacterized protein n=1 Tax=Araneus ventricosus TaxID=182803 RepID=A0A4Y2CP53_ARAVE|nr:hypothetical protein AVEN_175542-1 [Araneus ventricosus]
MKSSSPDIMANLACWSTNSFPGIPTWALTQERLTMFFALKLFDFTLLTNSDLVFALLMADIEERLSVCMSAQVLSSSSDHGSKLQGPSQNSPCALQTKLSLVHADSRARCRILYETRIYVLTDENIL